MKENGFDHDVFDMTKTLEDLSRWEQILKWINSHKVNKFIIFDDVENESIEKYFPDNFIKCKHKKGLRNKNYKKALKLFKKL
jgi:hypothetical protein